MNDLAVQDEVRSMYTRKIRTYADAARILSSPKDQMQILILINLCCEAMTGSQAAAELLRKIEDEVGTR